MAGKYYDDLTVGQRIRHEVGRTLADYDNILFSTLTMNPSPLHINADYMSRSEYGKPLINGIFTLGVVVGITVQDLTAGTIIANLGYEQVRHPKPMFAGDTLYVETEVLEKRESQSRPDAGVVKLKHFGRNQDGEICIEATRSVLFLKRPQ
ncbi:MAG: MaoC family dehydratase [Anaerolineae bacterium]|jgi:acyl dehydratase|nr:MaoC family dehydratase [Anaerolineae bacterium]